MSVADEADELVIRSEEDAWRALNRAITGTGELDNFRLRFEGWPVLTLDVKGRDWHSTVPTRVMPALLDAQRDINRAYAQVSYGEFNLRRLREEERDDLEIVVKVDKGSSIFNADLWEQFNKMAAAAVGRMTGTEIVITVLGASLMLTASVMFKAWLSARRKEKELESRIQLSQEETERLKIMAAAVKQEPALQVVHEDAQATSNRLLKATRRGDQMKIKGVELAAEEAHELVQPERERAKAMDISGEFAIVGNRTDKGAGFRVTVKRVSDGLQLAADVEAELPWDDKEAIKQAEWSKKLVALQIEAEMLREAITRAVVVSAKPSVDKVP